MTRPAALVALLLAAVAHAHGVVPQTLDVFPRPGSTRDVLVGTTFGGLLTHDDGATFSWLCEEAIGLTAGQRAAWLYSSQGTLFAGGFAGLFSSRDQGCSWAAEPTFAATGVASLTQAGGVLYVTSARFGATNALWSSHDDGVTFTRTGLEGATEFFSVVLAAPSRPERVYVSAWYFDPPANALLRSDDAAATFARVTLTTSLPAPGAFTLLAVHPTNPDVLLATVTEDARAPRSWLLRSVDGGEHFSVLLTLTTSITHAAFADDGHRAWVAAGDVLYGSRDDGATFTPLAAPTRSTCISVGPGVAWACGKQEVDGFGLGRSAQTNDFAAWLTWQRLSGPPACSPTAVTTLKCGPYWPVLRDQLGLDAGVDGVDGGTSPGGRGGCGCDVSSATGLCWLCFLGCARRRPRVASRR